MALLYDIAQLAEGAAQAVDASLLDVRSRVTGPRQGMAACRKGMIGVFGRLKDVIMEFDKRITSVEAATFQTVSVGVSSGMAGSDLTNRFVHINNSVIDAFADDTLTYEPMAFVKTASGRTAYLALPGEVVSFKSATNYSALGGGIGFAASNGTLTNVMPETSSKVAWSVAYIISHPTGYTDGRCILRFGPGLVV